MKKPMVKACTTASGAVFFVEDTIKRKKRPVSYDDMAGTQKPRIQETRGLFTRWLPRSYAKDSHAEQTAARKSA